MADTYDTKNGQQTVSTMAQQLKNAGWGGDTSNAASVVNAYATTTGQSVTPKSTSSSTSSSSGGTPTPTPAPAANAGGDLGGQIDKLLASIASGNKQAFDETVREFNQTYGLDQAKFTEAVRQFNQGFLISQAGVTGQYQGAPTLAALKQQADIAAQKLAGAQADASLTGTYQGQATLASLKQQADIASQQLQNAMTAAGLTGVYNGQQTQAAQAQQFGQGVTAAGLTGMYNGQETLAAQAQNAGLYGYNPTVNAQGQPISTNGQPLTTLAAQQQAYAQQMGAVNSAAALQANPFRQAQVIGQAGRILQGMPTAGFGAPNTVTGVGTAGGNTQGGMGYLQQLIDDIKDPSANQTTADSFLGQTPTPNKIDSASFLRSTPGTQNLILQAMQERYGIDPQDSLKQIQNTLPAFNAPNTVGMVRRG
jgi:hypothetical protein